jgi:hypothetical protein
MEDAALQKKNSYSVRCVSTTGELLRIDTAQFYMKTAMLKDAWEDIEKVNNAKSD